MNKKNIFYGIVFLVFLAILILTLGHGNSPYTPTKQSSFSTSSPSEISTTTARIVSPAENKIHVTFSADGKKYFVALPVGSTVYDAMNALASTTDFSFKADFFSGIGYFVEEINGVKNQNGEYWILYVDGSYSNVGASARTLSDGDSVEWKYEK